LDIETATGVMQLFPLEAKHGTGARRFRITVEGIVFENVVLRRQCFISFRGQRLGGSFSKVKQVDFGSWHVVFETVIANPEFWQ
jgi:hypothetical protein